MPGLAPYLSPRWGDGKINPNTAPAEILRSLSPQLTEDRVQTILARRQAQPFLSVQEVANLWPGWPTFMDDVGADLQVSSLFFAIELTSTIGKTDSFRGSTRRALIHILRTQQDVTVFYWEPL